MLSKGEKILLLTSCKGDFTIIRNLAHNITASNSNEITTIIFESEYCTDQNIAQVLNTSSNGQFNFISCIWLHYTVPSIQHNLEKFAFDESKC